MPEERVEYVPFNSLDAYENDDKAYNLDPPDNRTVNVPLLRKMLEHITAHPEEWDQDTWASESETSTCGTSFCLAGHVVNSLGHPLVWRENLDHTAYCLADGQLRTIESVAIHALGIDNHDADCLFAASNSLYDLWNTARDITNGEIDIPDEVRGR